MNGQADWQAQQKTHLVFHLGRAEVLRGLWNFLNVYRPEHHSIDRLKERGVEKGSGQHSTSEVGNDLCSARQTLALFRDRAERGRAFQSTTIPF